MTAPDSTASPDLTRAIADFAFGSRPELTHGSRPLAWLSPDEMKIDLADPGQRRFGDYELLEQIGQGGMGVVYRARQHGLGRDVAVKLLAAGPWASDEFVERFRREAHHAARMQHPNIVEIYEFGHRDGLNYFSMRLVEGRSLAHRLATTGPMSDSEAAKCVRLLAEAMDYAHRLDVLHLDLKPANVLMGSNGEPLIADFGLARRIDAGGSGGSEEISGTPCYMAPEQALHQSHPLSASTDIYGLGAILYEVLTARPPFRGDDAQATLESVVNELPTSPCALRPGVSADLEAICLRCLEKQPTDRYASARELAEDLQRFLDGHPVSAHPLDRRQRLVRWTRREPKLALAVGSALLALALGIAAAGTAWRQARQALSDAEFLGLETLLPTARNSSILELSRIIREQLTRKARRSRAKTLAASPDPNDWLAAGLVGQTLIGPDRVALGDQSLARAAKAQPTDPLTLIAAIHYCGIKSERSAEDEPWITVVSCAVPDAPSRLAKVDPQNLFARLSLLDPPGLDPDQVGPANWRYEHDPVVHARTRALIAYAAGATKWDDGMGAILAAKAKAFGVGYFPMPFGNISRDQEETASAEDLRGSLAGVWTEAWSMAGPYLPMLSRACDPERGALDSSLRADCMRIFRLLADSKGHIGANVIGWRGLAQLGKGTSLQAEMSKRMRGFIWLREQNLWSLDRDPLASGRQFTQDFLRFGQWEAMQRQADRVRVPRQPPPGWRSRFYTPPWITYADPDDAERRGLRQRVESALELSANTPESLDSLRRKLRAALTEQSP